MTVTGEATPLTHVETAKRYFFEAVALLDAGDFKGGAQRLREALVFAPENVSILTNLAGALMMAGNYAEARAAAERIVVRDAGNLGAHLVIAECLTREGRHADAVAALDRIIALQPEVAEHHSNRSAALNRLRRHDEALASADRAIALNPNLAAAHLNRANALADRKRNDDALTAYERAMALAPNVAEAWLGCGVVLARKSKPAEAMASFERALASAPGLTDAMLGRADALAALNRHDEAVAAFDQAVARDPARASAWFGRGASLAALRRDEEALAAYDRTIEIDPDFAQAWLGRGATLAALGRHDQAHAAYARALNIHDRDLAADPALASAWFGRGSALTAIGRDDEALEAFGRALANDAAFAAACIARGDIYARGLRATEALADYDNAIDLDPDSAQAWLRRGDLLATLERYDEADAAYRRAIAIRSRSAPAWLGLGMVLALRKRLEEAVDAYDRALAIDPGVGYAQGGRLSALARLCDWRRYDAERAQLVAAVRSGARAIVPFLMIHMASSAADQLACGRIYVAEKWPSPATKAARPPRGSPDRINIAYVSADFRYHPVALLLAGLFEHHDRARFRTTAFSFGADDDTAIRRRLKGAFDSFVDVDRIGDAATAELMAEREIDIAIDLMGFTSGCRPGIFARRAAPIQVNYLGFPGTMGATFMDYIIADPYLVPPEFEPFYAERIARLPDTFQGNDALRPYPTRVPSRPEVSLPDGEFVFCSFNSLDKITPEIFGVWMGLLHNAPDGILWLLSESPATERNLRREAQARGIAPERIVFAPRAPYAGYLERYRAADLFLDTFPFNGGTTVSDALWMGLPVVTVSGEAYASRMAGSLLCAVGAPELATQSLAEYRHLAATLAADRPRLAAIRSKIAHARTTSPLFDTARFCRHLEAAYAIMHERHLRGEPPASFTVEPIDRPA